MTATTKTYGLTYPIETDPISTLPDILQTQAETIDTLLSGFDFNGQDADRYASRLTAAETNMTKLNETVATLNNTITQLRMTLTELGTVRTGAFTFDGNRMNVSSNRLLRIGNMVFATCLYSYKSGVVSGANASVATVLSIPDGFRAALKTRVSVTHNRIAPGVDDSAVEGNRLSQWNINDSTSSFSLMGIWVTNDD